MIEEPGVLPSRRERHRRSRGRTVALVLVLILSIATLLGVGYALLNQQRVADQLAVWGYEPPLAIAGYAERSAMSDEGRFLFYASRPVVADEAQFDRTCSSTEAEVGILGCYLTGPRTIFLFDITDERLDGMEEVVAAHEMLHAAWDRMSASERERLGALLEVEAGKLGADQAFAERLEVYARMEPGERQNELHSIIGTEVADIAPALEAHYSRFFSDRGAVTALHATSNAVFTEHQRRIEALVLELDALAAAIDADYAAYNAGYDRLNADIDDFNARADSGAFTTQSQFDRERAALLQRQAQLDADYAAIETRAGTHEQLLAELESLNAEVDELNESVNIEPRNGDDL